MALESGVVRVSERHRRCGIIICQAKKWSLPPHVQTEVTHSKGTYDKLPRNPVGSNLGYIRQRTLQHLPAVLTCIERAVAVRGIFGIHVMTTQIIADLEHASAA